MTLLLLFLMISTSASAWDAHHLITNSAIDGIQATNPRAWAALNQPVVVHPIEAFLTRAFGSQCQLDLYKNFILEGVGPGYSIQYTEGVQMTLQIDWDRGFTTSTLVPIQQDPFINSQALDSQVLPRSVLAIYSDEPDWQMDDNVARLKDVGVTKGIVGAGTRVLRHFWYKGQAIFTVDMGEGQELDRRVQLFYELSLIAFSINEHYWGYRYLANALHYIQDLTQPFHVQANMGSGMIFTNEMIQAALCDFPHHDPSCRPDQTIAHEKIHSGWLTGFYHGMYEDFVRGLIESNVYSTRSFISETSTVAPLPLQVNPTNGTYRMDNFIEHESRLIREYADTLSDDLLGTIGDQFRYHMDLVHHQIEAFGTSESLGYQYGAARSYYDFPETLGHPLTQRQQQTKQNLFRLTHELLEHAGMWSRQVVESTLEQYTGNSFAATNVALREHYRSLCLPQRPRVASQRIRTRRPH